jgi:hypothetical protein
MHNPGIDICRTILNIEQFLFSAHPYLERLIFNFPPISDHLALTVSFCSLEFPQLSVLVIECWENVHLKCGHSPLPG